MKLKEINVSDENLIAFLDDIKKEDLEELIEESGQNYKKEFIKAVLAHRCFCYFLADSNNNPVAIGGFKPMDSCNYAALVWLLCTNRAEKYKKELYKYVLDKIKIFKKYFGLLFNNIYKSNFSSLKWLKKCGFKVKDLEDSNYKLFYFNKEGYIDLRYTSGKQLHRKRSIKNISI